MRTSGILTLLPHWKFSKPQPSLPSQRTLVQQGLSIICSCVLMAVGIWVSSFRMNNIEAMCTFSDRIILLCFTEKGVDHAGQSNCTCDSCSQRRSQTYNGDGL